MMYRYLSEGWHRMFKERPPELKEKLMRWRREPRIVRVERPSRLDRARRLGYKAKQGFVVLRVRVPKGGMRRRRPRSGRRQKALGTVKIKGGYSAQEVAEERARRTHPNLVALGSYYLMEDGRYHWYEVVMVDPDHPSILADGEMRRKLNPKTLEMKKMKVERD